MFYILEDILKEIIGCNNTTINNLAYLHIIDAPI